jgi:membrane protein
MDDMDRGAVAAAPPEASQAQSPARFGLRGWMRAIGRALRLAMARDFPLIAAGVAFYGFLSLAPFLAAVTTFYGWLADPADIRAHLGAIEDVAPPGVHEVVASQADAVLSARSRTLGWASVVGFVLAVWTARVGVQALISGIAVAYREPRGRGFLRDTLVTYALTLASIAAAAAALAAVVVAPAVVSLLPLGPVGAAAATLAPWPIALAALILVLGLLYREAPMRRPARLSWLSAGAVAATALWLAGSAALSFYVARFAALNETYGVLGGVAGLLLWFWLSALAALFGAALNAELELETAADTTVGPDRPMGERGAWVADHVAA